MKTGNSPSKSWAVHKFGGTSVGSAERYQVASQIIQKERQIKPELKPAVVVSAMKGVTDALIDLVTLAKKKNDGLADAMAKIKKRHEDAIVALQIQSLLPVFEKDFQELAEILRGVWLAQSASESIVELVSGMGEVWSAQILATYLNQQKVPAKFLNAKDVLLVESTDSSKTVHVFWEESQSRMNAWLETNGITDQILVITGFVASTKQGIATTLKRNGSDFSGSIFGQLLNAKEITIWTDVDGVLSADPRLVPDAVVLNEMSYNEVTELAHFGAKVVHPATMEPAIRLGIPVWIRNTFNPDFPGTKIHANAKSDTTVKGFSAIENMAVLNIEGSGMVGVLGVAERLFGSLRSVGISAVMISQASSEHSICIAVPEAMGDRAKEAIQKTFFAEIHQGVLDRIDLVKGKSILAAVGDNMAEKPGVAGQFFTALGRAGVNIHAIAQGSSERNISAVIDAKDTSVALRTVHSAFFLSPQTIAIGVIGAGLIGKEFLKQLQNELPRLKDRHEIDFRIRAITNSSEMVLDGKDERGIDPAAWESLKREPASFEKFIQHLKSSHLPHAVIIDATASDEPPKHYAEWLKAGFHIITPNKKANSQSYSLYQELKELSLAKNRRFLYSTNVCAGLPVLQTLKELIQTGDQMHKLEGVFSGTLSYLLNTYDGKRPFSEVVLEAKRLGYTEPDPRDDLSGTDVARKLVILAREAGGRLDLSDIPVENLVPENLRKVSVDEYFSRIHEGDAAMAERFGKASATGGALRYIGSVDSDGKAKVSLEAVSNSHPFYNLKGADNIVAFQTARYQARPMVIQGPGAGPAVTAAGVFADLLRLASSLGARR